MIKCEAIADCSGERCNRYAKYKNNETLDVLYMQIQK